MTFFFISASLGLLLGLILQVAHCTEGVSIKKDQIFKVNNGFYNQINCTSNYCPENKIITWYTGGLNYHIEHHLFPNISSVHYPNLSKLVKNHCKNLDIPYKTYDTYFFSLKAHFEYLKKLGRYDTSLE